MNYKRVFVLSTIMCLMISLSYAQDSNDTTNSTDTDTDTNQTTTDGNDSTDSNTTNNETTTETDLHVADVREFTDWMKGIIIGACLAIFITTIFLVIYNRRLNFFFKSCFSKCTMKKQILALPKPTDEREAFEDLTMRSKMRLNQMLGQKRFQVYPSAKIQQPNSHQQLQAQVEKQKHINESMRKSITLYKSKTLNQSQKANLSKNIHTQSKLMKESTNQTSQEDNYQNKDQQVWLYPQVKKLYNQVHEQSINQTFRKGIVNMMMHKTPETKDKAYNVGEEDHSAIIMEGLFGRDVSFKESFKETPKDPEQIFIQKKPDQNEQYVKKRTKSKYIEDC